MPQVADVRQFFWPPLTDDKSSAKAVEKFSKWIFALSGSLLLVGFLDLLVVSFAAPVKQNVPGASVGNEFVWYTIAFGVVFGLIAWRIRKMSGAWAVAGLVICIIGAIAILPSPFGFAIYVFFALIFANTVRAIRRHNQAFRTQAAG